MLEEQFHERMLEIHRRAKSEARYNPAAFLAMLEELGGVETARRLIDAPTVSGGYTSLWERKRLDLTVEAVVLQEPKWHPLFTSEEIEICRKRLRKYGYPPEEQ